MQHQSYAHGLDHFEADPDLAAVLARYWPDSSAHREELSRWGILGGGKAYEIADHVDRAATPELVHHDLDGRRVDRVRLSPAQRDLMVEMAPINRPAYEGGSWHQHFAQLYLISDPGLTCIPTVTNQTAYAIHKYAPEHSRWIEPLLSGEAFGATWMTEVQGGSDLGANTVTAIPADGGWRLDGEKYFCSVAGLTDLAIVTARPPDGRAGAKGLALFLVPRLRDDGELNFAVRRLKRKSATRSVPSGEVSFSNTEAWLVGEADQGIYYTLENFTLSRLANAVGAMGIARKVHLETMLRVQHRQTFGSPLSGHPLVRRDLAEFAARTAGGLALSFYAIDAFDRCWNDRPPYGADYHHARFVSHLTKMRTAEHAVALTTLAMELFGALGFVEDFAINRWHREAMVTPIWEGGANLQALDMLEVMQRKDGHHRFVEQMTLLLQAAGTQEAGWALQALDTAAALLQAGSARAAQWQAKHACRALADAAQVALLYDLASSEERYEQLAALYSHHAFSLAELPDWADQILIFNPNPESA